MISKTFLCITFYYKGSEFLRQCKNEGNTVFLLTKKKLENKPWPWESIDEVFYMENDENTPENISDILLGVAWLMRKHKIDRVVALDDFDVEKAAAIREEFRIPGMGQTTARYFRDKLAMRIQARDAGLRVPAFSALFNDEEINQYADTVAAPWLVKPRSEASATGIKKVFNKEHLWEVVNSLGNRRHLFLVEQFKPGDVYHVDALTVNGEMVFNWTSRYLSTPFDVAHGAGIFRSVTLEHDSQDDRALKAFNRGVMKAFGMKNSASHTEYIKCHEDGEYYFLETSARVGGAHLGTMVEAASGINLWKEWARLESCLLYGQEYVLPEVNRRYSGILISLARQQFPDMSPFNDPEVYCHIPEEHHVALILHADHQSKVLELLDRYALIVKEHYHASAPALDKPSH